jgi:hypothetical protein
MTAIDDNLCVNDESDPSMLTEFNLFVNPKASLAERTASLDAAHAKLAIAAAVSLVGAERATPLLHHKHIHGGYYHCTSHRAACQAIAELCQAQNCQAECADHTLTRKRLVPQPTAASAITPEQRETMKSVLGLRGVASDMRTLVSQHAITRFNIHEQPLGEALGHRRVFLPREPDAVVSTRRWLAGRGWTSVWAPAVLECAYRYLPFGKAATLRELAGGIHAAYTEIAACVAKKLQAAVLPRQLQWTPETAAEVTRLKAEFIRQVKLGLGLYTVGDLSQQGHDEYAQSCAMMYAIVHGGVRDASIAPLDELSRELFGRHAMVGGGDGSARHRGWTTALPTHGIGDGMFNRSKAYAKADGFSPRDYFTFRHHVLSDAIMRLQASGITFTSTPDEIQTQVYYAFPPSPFVRVGEYWAAHRSEFDFLPLSTLAVGGPRTMVAPAERCDGELPEELCLCLK